ncbi:antigen peptide transporter 2a isoform 2-T2 [Pholidichthys leucotaenia]
MAGDTPTTMQRIVALILAVCADLSLFYASGFAIVAHNAFGHVARLWLCAALRWVALTTITLFTLGDIKPLLIRFITGYSLLPAVFETGIKALYSEESKCGQLGDARCWLLSAGASLSAALFWEITIPDTDEPADGREKQKARVLFMRVLRLYRPDCLLLLGGLVFLSLAVICEMFIPFYTGRVIDILGSHYQQSDFLSALLFMGLYSLGSSASAGCRGGFLLCAISSFTCRIKVKLFEALTKQEIGFFETIKTGEITSRLSKDTTLMGRTVCLNMNVLLRTFIKTMGMILLMMSLSWKLTFLVLMETPIAGLIQNVHDTHYQTLTYIFGDMLNSVGAAGKVFEYLDRKPQVSTDGELKPDQVKGHVSFHNLSFAYPAKPDKTVLQNFSLELKPGQMTALVGPSGEGKSTCVSLLEHFYEPQDGEILLDSQPLKSYDHRFLHKKIAVVSQEPVLFSGSIRENIEYGLTDCSMEEIQEAARRANAHDFIMEREKGYNTEVGEGGGQLSKSEKQRIAIARALVRRPQVLILDEITSSLDAENENKIQQTLSNIPNQTLLVIAHRLKTIESADQIVVISGGNVAERGTHQQLMDMKGRYYKLREELFAEGN